MSVEWLKARVPGFAELPHADCDEVTSFFWLWSFFEANCLSREGNIPAIQRLVRGWQERGPLNRGRFEQSLVYFKGRYFNAEGPTAYYPHLHMDEHKKKDQELVSGVLSGENEDDGDVISVVLVVVYRFRNNLVHGEKWAYELRDQLENFRHANAILRTAIEMDGRGIHLPQDR